MSDPIKHECGLAFIRLRKNLSYYQQKYGTALYGISKLYLLMEKQHNRGQDGAGVGVVKLHTEPGYPFMHRMRSNAPQPIQEIFQKIGESIKELEKYNPEILKQPGFLKGHVDMLGEVMLGHLRYGTQGKNDVEFCHPFVKRNTIPGRNMVLAGNFNMVNTEEIFDSISMVPGDFQKQSDLAALVEIIYHHLQQEDELNPHKADLKNVMSKAFNTLDGGYLLGGITGNGDAFVARDAHGIRPGYYYIDDEVIVAASERAAIRTAFNVGENQVQELMPGKALLVNAAGECSVEQIMEPKERKACSFERIYFSRGSDEKIYRERQMLGYLLSERILKAVDHNLRDTIFSYIPNTAETAFYGLVKGAQDYLDKIKLERILGWGNNIDPVKLEDMITRKVRIEKIAIKDVKLRTFITADSGRNEMVQHVYDITYGTVRPDVDTLVVIDDSIVRGTTLKESIVRMLARLKPKKIIVVSSAPQIRYPDCYGIDMSKLGDFVAFRAAIELLKEQNQAQVLDEILADCKKAEDAKRLGEENFVKRVYELFSEQEISAKIAELITPANIHCPVEVIYQDIKSLHEACPNNKGDWYFTGDYPTKGGNRVVNKAFINYMEGKDVRGY